MRHVKCRALVLGSAAGLILGMTSGTQVQAAVWTGSSSGAWTNSANWTGTAPTQFGVQPIVFAAAGAGNLTTDVATGGQFFISDLSTNTNATSFAINNSGGGVLAISGDIFINQGASNLSASIACPIFFNKVANTTLTFNVDGVDRSLSAVEVQRHVSSGLRPGQTVIKSGTGFMSFSGNSTYHGQTQINAGRLNVNGTHANGDVYQVNTTGTLGGSGTITAGINVNAGGTLAPGQSIGTFSSGSVALTSASSILSFEVDVDATPAADLLRVTGTLSLGDGILDLSAINSPDGSFPRTYMLAANDGTDAISGNFTSITGLPSGYSATIDKAFNGTDALGRTGTGNDLAVTIVIPEPASIGAIGGIGMLTLRRRRD